MSKKIASRNKIAIHKMVRPDARVGDTLCLDDGTNVDIIAEGNELYWIGKRWPRYRYAWWPIRAWFIRTYCDWTGRKWV